VAKRVGSLDWARNCANCVTNIYFASERTETDTIELGFERPNSIMNKKRYYCTAPFCTHKALSVYNEESSA